MCLCVDVLMTLRSPFSSREKRLWLGAILSLLFGLLSLFSNGVVNDETLSLIATDITAVVAIVIYPVTAIGTITYVLCKLREPHISKEL